MGGERLSRPEVEALFGQLMDGGVSDIHKAGLLVALAMRGESAEEIAGAAAAMRARAVRIPHSRERVLDTCGTGGDGRGTFNISTAAALVAAAAGAVVAKHGNRSVSSRSGSADVLAALGVELELAPGRLGAVLDAIGIAFLFAPKLHPAMREVMPVRRELAVRTLFNVLGPLTNPAGASRQLLGVYSPALVEPLARVLAELGSERAWVVHGDGFDEITTTGPTTVGEARDGEVRVWEFDAADYGLPRARPEDLAGGAPEENAAAMRRLFDGEPGPLRDVVAVNAAAALLVSGNVESIADGLDAASGAIDSGAAASKLDSLRRFSRESCG
jgi:anthranilate phosphoribosyltransferase